MADEFTKAALYWIKTFNKKVKEKIWMQKLLDLLNEYEFKVADTYNYSEREATEDDLERLSERIISKKYWFIEWLVENDKIDTDAYKTVYSGDLDKRKTLTMSSGWDEFYQVTEHWVYESLLMLLSISDTPIEDLISYLK